MDACDSSICAAGVLVVETDSLHSQFWKGVRLFLVGAAVVVVAIVADSIATYFFESVPIGFSFVLALGGLCVALFAAIRFSLSFFAGLFKRRSSRK